MLVSQSVCMTFGHEVLIQSVCLFVSQTISTPALQAVDLLVRKSQWIGSYLVGRSVILCLLLSQSIYLSVSQTVSASVVELFVAQFSSLRRNYLHCLIPFLNTSKAGFYGIPFVF